MTTYAEPQQWRDAGTADREAFLQSIHADPFDAINHLVFADWLEEQGESEEADFRRKLGEWFGHPVWKPEPPHEIKGGWKLNLGFGGDFPRFLDPEDVDYWDVSGAGTISPENAYRNGNKSLTWREYKHMEEGLRRAFLRKKTREARPPEQLSRYADEPEPEWTDPRAPFEAAIDANPYDPLAHGVYSDWLRENGFEDEADFHQSMMNWKPHNHDIVPWRARQLGAPEGNTAPFPIFVDQQDLPEGILPDDIHVFEPGSINESIYTPHVWGGLPRDPIHAASWNQYLGWQKYRNMEEAFRRAFLANRERQRQNPTQASRYADEPQFQPQDEYGRPLTDFPPPLTEPPEIPETISPVDAAFAPQDELGRSASITPPNPPSLPPVSPSPAPEAPSQPQVPSVQDATGFAPSRDIVVDHSRLGESLAEAFSHYEEPDDLARYTEAAHFMAQSIPRWAQERLATDGRLQRVQSHKKPEDVRRAWEALGEETGTKQPEGFYDPDTGTVVVNDVDPVGAMAHEVGHAIDWDPSAISPKGEQGHYVLSGTPEWNRAWTTEIFHGRRLSQYGRIDPTEGFAEAIRAVHAYPQGRELFAQELPMCYAYLASIGLV